MSPNDLWARVLKGVYFPKDDFMKASKGHKASWCWSSILDGREFFRQDLRLVVGDGADLSRTTAASRLHHGAGLVLIQPSQPTPRRRVDAYVCLSLAFPLHHLPCYLVLILEYLHLHNNGICLR